MGQLSKQLHEYRAEIDGLRAIAVSAVMIYHLKLPYAGTAFLPGGFLGVDLFFVLSGFLITSLLLAEFAAQGRISMRNFYYRRARRILPPLLLVMLVSLPAAYLILLPGEVARFELSLISGLAFASNIFWFLELSEYGAQSGLLQPFLHLWSLAIEEQFYLLFPPVLILILRRWGIRSALILCSAGVLLGLLAAEALTWSHPALSFFSPTSRAWEPLAGSVLACLARTSPGFLRSATLCRIIPPLSLLTLLLGFVLLRLDDIRHPGLVTLPVVLASCGLIWFCRPGDPVTRLLSLPPMVSVGKLSYSLYLWHFPIFAFGRQLAVGTPTAADMAVWLGLTVALSWLGYQLVEKPFRFHIRDRVFSLTTAAASLVLVATSLLFASGVFAAGARVTQLAALYGAAEIDNEKLALESWSLLAARAPDEAISQWNATRASDHEQNDLWFSAAADSRVLILGDSHAKDMYNALALNQSLFPGVEFARFTLSRKTLSDDLLKLQSAPNFKASDTLMIAPRYYSDHHAYLSTVLSSVKGTEKTIIIVGNTAEFDLTGDLPLFDWYVRRLGSSDDLNALNTVAPKYLRQATQEIEAGVQGFAQSAGLAFLSRQKLVCPDELCWLATTTGQKTMYDDTHWTLDGARLFGEQAARAGWLAR